MAQQLKVGKKSTKIYMDGDGFTCVKYHDTVVIKFKGGNVVLNSGGWQTATTKGRINQAFNQYNLPFSLYQKAGEWYVQKENETPVEFFDGITLVV